MTVENKHIDVLFQLAKRSRMGVLFVRIYIFLIFIKLKRIKSETQLITHNVYAIIIFFII